MLINIVSELRMNFIEIRQSIENKDNSSNRSAKKRRNRMVSSRYINTNRILAAITFLISFIVYFDTMAPSKFIGPYNLIAVSYTLGVPHPPEALYSPF